MENKSFKMRRNGGALNRATENTEEHNISTNSARTMAQYGMSDSGMNFGAPLNSNHGPGDEEETDAERRDRLSVGEKGSGRGRGGQRTFAGGKATADVGKERGATDLAAEIPKVYNKVKKKIKSYF